MPQRLTMTADHETTLGMILRGLGILALAAGVAVVAVFAAAAAAVIAVLIAGAAIALRFMPHPEPARARGPQTLDARRTPEGWVVETRTRRSS